ncbi:hypothetical protein [Nostoc sp. C052]|nr:hypothetical protein [Nostoc sp. C052]
MTHRVKEILSWYGSDNPGTLTNLARWQTSWNWQSRHTACGSRL